MANTAIYFWKGTPFIRLLISLSGGIILQWYYEYPFRLLAAVFICALLITLSYFWLPIARRFSLSIISGCCISILFAALGAMLTWRNDIRNSPHWFSVNYREDGALVVTLAEPLADKPGSKKAIAMASYVIEENKKINVTGKLILYFDKKDSTTTSGLDYGSQVIIKKNLQPIKNSGNPGAFDYRRYSLFQGITHQVFLKKGDFQILPGKNKNWLTSLLITIREKTITIIKQYIPGKAESGLAEALLIGYKNDLDKSLVQSYSNTGVVHIIAISGLHLGLIYWLLLQLFKPLKKRRLLYWLSPVLTITGLWLFSLLAGAQPSVLRSTLMFSCIVAGESIGRKTNIYNSLALSAFLLLCYNPYWLWDVGFQLSYAAVLSIVIFMRPVYNLFYIKDKLADSLWKLNAVTLSAQVLTIPICLFYFHQFPNYFLLTNLVAVPLSSAILLGEIFLCTISFIPLIAGLTGNLLSWLIRLMNAYVETIEKFPFSTWSGFQITLVQVILLYIFIGSIGYSLIERSKLALIAGLITIFGFVCLRSISFIQAKAAKKLIVYNVPKQNAIDFINGRHFVFMGDSSIQDNEFIRQFHLTPARLLNRATNDEANKISGGLITWHGKHIMLLNEPLRLKPVLPKPVIDLIIISHNPRLYINHLAAALDIRKVVFDSSVPAWKSKYWKKDCDSLRIPWYDVTENGAFELCHR